MIDISALFNQFLMPQQCLLCGAAAHGIALCKPCRDELPWSAAACCPVCALPTLDGLRCGKCLQSPPAFDATLALLRYAYPADVLLRRHKYSELLPVAELIGTLMAERYGNESPDLLIPMPLHPQRLQQRGFNQAVEIARSAGHRLGLAVAAQACRRTRPTVPQAGLPWKERRSNVRRAFACDMELSGRHVALIDDVMTTGASLNELAHCVKKAGAVRVDCWVAARTQLD